MKSFSDSYKAAGVDVVAGYQAVELMKSHVKRTQVPGVLSGLGGFGGLFQPDVANVKEPVLVSGTDGVGTKLKIAFLMDKHDTVGQDCVAMCVNDIICAGARPLFFLDYIALGKNVPEKVAQIVKGVADGCVKAGCALIGGETAEMPGFYPEDEYDLAGFSVGMVDKSEILDSGKVKKGDALIGLASTGVHSNGFSLVRKILNVNREKLEVRSDDLGCSLGEALLRPTQIYVKPVLRLIEQKLVKAVSHITGGGFYENLPRMLPQGAGLAIEKKSFPILPIFELLADLGKVPERDMFNTFNMGIGMALVVASEDAEKALKLLEEEGQEAYLIGQVTDSGEIVIC